MPTARETLLEAAHAAVRARPWAGVRMVDVAAAAGVSRQTLYNEFGSKEGLGAALVNRLVEDFLDGTARAVAEAGRDGADPAACCAAAAHWMLRAAREEPIVHAALTGCWGARMPLPPGSALPPGSGPGIAGEPARLALLLRHRAISGLEEVGWLPVGGPASGAAHNGATGVGPMAAGAGQRELERAYETGLRVALSYVVAPGEEPDEEPCGRIDEIVRALLGSG
ncbi:MULTISPECIES: TetR/AcrR family transcriptional regulator [unclassified Streptomyces]|uniref:TetR/AcrR family transcriptional regulator n=1 Tax=unclassified Streptomyces TaxID=2593676 RepID=UPI002DD92703|nr:MULTISPECIES: TetR/AcrR family transcriptional regulator [unclassified Streptomyces]WSB76839.1 TetR/AcrR family transcriptional regulator [Streptomyces sp. NBC_01775]WSS14887.1 TetR/AcrR family transcriptional regulator [Streptomyces sp. NBC_01186]WSS43730.1 TetR/AcrR family transcriptional regulator [Streptomyces sp. NBC_01187]